MIITTRARLFITVCLTIALSIVTAPAVRAAEETTDRLTAHCVGEGDVIVYGDWECRDPRIYSPWGNLVRTPNSTFDLVTDGVRQGQYAARFEVADSGATSSERSEPYWLTGADGHDGDLKYYAFSIKFPSNWPVATRSCCIVSQWRATGDTSSLWGAGWPPLWLETPNPNGGDYLGFKVRAGQCNLASETEPAYCPVNASYPVMSGADFRSRLGKWHDFVVGVTWSSTTSGTVQVWYRNEGTSTLEQVLNLSGQPTLRSVRRTDGTYEVGRTYPKFGLYRPHHVTVTQHLYNDSYCAARTFTAAVSCLPG